MKVLLVDDHPLILSALQAMIQELDPDVKVTAVGSAAAARSALAADANFDLVLLDLQLGDASGFDVLVIGVMTPAVLSTPTEPVVGAAAFMWASLAATEQRRKRQIHGQRKLSRDHEKRPAPAGPAFRSNLSRRD